MRDEVDELVEAWERERDDLDLAPVAVFSRISRLARHLDLARREIRLKTATGARSRSSRSRSHASTSSSTSSRMLAAYPRCRES